MGVYRESAPSWLWTLWAERAAAAAKKEHLHLQRQEQAELRELAVEQSALAKVKAGKHRFSEAEWVHVSDWAFRSSKELVRGDPGDDIAEFDRQVLAVAGVDADDHTSWLVHLDGCDGDGSRCAVRIEQLRVERRVEALLDSVAKKTAVREAGWVPGQFVTTWYGSRVGVVVKVNKVTVKVRLAGSQGPYEKNLDPRCRQPAPASLPAPPAIGDEVVVRDRGGHSRHARVVAVDGPLLEATYSLKSGQWRSRWFDLLASQSTPGAL